MRFGVYCANFGVLGEARTLIDLALEAEESGWDGFFLYDHITVLRERAVRSVDPWTVLAILAERTQLIFGPLITPVARRQPWELAYQTIALNRLSGGRLILGVGLGEPPEHEAFGPPTTPRERGERLDEGLEIVRALWAGESVTRAGAWRLSQAAIAPGPVTPIPVWVAGRYGSARPLRRAARFDGFFPIGRTWELDAMLDVDQLAELAEGLRRERGSLSNFAVVTAGLTAPGSADLPRMEAFQRAGATWWLEVIEPRRGGLEELRARIVAGPPRPQEGHHP